MSFREIETKVWADISLNRADSLIRDTFQKSLETSSNGQGTDTYWHTENPLKSVRIRENPGYTEMTVKSLDLGTVTNRLEINLITRSDINVIKAYNTALFGEPAGSVHKLYANHHLMDGTVVTCYQVSVNGEDKDGTYLEVEAPSSQVMEHRFSQLVKVAKSKKIELILLHQALYQTFFNKEAV